MKKITINNGHNIYEIDVNRYQDALNWAKETAYAKTEHTVDTWQERGKCKRFTNLFLGDLAKNLFKLWMIKMRPMIESYLIEYDQIRTDNFYNSDEFDLKLECNQRVCSIEVKSSGEKYTKDTNALYNNRRIIINIESPHSHLDCVYTQILFVPSHLEFFENKNIDCDEYDNFVDRYFALFKEQNIKAYIVGYANKNMQAIALGRDTFCVENTKANAKSRTYANLLVKDAKSPDEFIKVLDEFCL